MTNLQSSRFYDLLPPNLHNETTRSLSAAVDRQMRELVAFLPATLLYANIPALPEKVCDHLARALRVQAYKADLALDVKRRLLQLALQSSSKKGTRFAVEHMLQTLYGDVHLKEWHEYGGKPFYYRMEAKLTQQGGVSDLFQYDPVSGTALGPLLDKVAYYKNLRSHLESIVVELQLDGAARVGHMLSEVNRTNIWPRLPTHLTGESTLRLGLYQSSAQAVVVRPKLPSSIQWESRWGIAHQLNSVQTVTVEPYQSLGIRRETSWSPAYRLHSVQAVTVGPLAYRPMQLAGSKRMGMLSSIIQATKIRAKGET